MRSAGYGDGRGPAAQRVRRPRTAGRRRALLYAACRDLQTAGETLRRRGRLFTPAEVTAYVSDEEAAAAARTGPGAQRRDDGRRRRIDKKRGSPTW